MLITEGLRLLEQASAGRRENPFAGLATTLFGGFCMVAGAILFAFGKPWYFHLPVFLLGLILAFWPKR